MLSHLITFIGFNQLKTIKNALILGSLLGFAGFASAQTVYITDEFEITMRTGMSTDNNIVRMLSSGEAVQLIESDEETRYSLVETEGGQQGYVLSRFLDESPSARERLSTLETTYQSLQTQSEDQRRTIDELTESLDQERADALSLKEALTSSDDELETLKVTAASTIEIEQQNQQLLSDVETLQAQVQQLSKENADLSDSTEIDWFVKGGGVSLIAFLVGILITRIRWRKSDSWGSF